MRLLFLILIGSAALANSHVLGERAARLPLPMALEDEGWSNRDEELISLLSDSPYRWFGMAR